MKSWRRKVIFSWYILSIRYEEQLIHILCVTVGYFAVMRFKFFANFLNESS